MEFFRRIKIGLVAFYDRLICDRVLLYSASLAYSTLLTLVPFFIVIFSILKRIPAFSGMESKIQQLVLENLATGSADILNSKVSYFLARMNQLGWVSIFILSLFVIVMMFNIAKAFNRIWNTTERYRFAVRFFIHILVLVLAPISFASLLLFSSYITSLNFLMTNHVISWVVAPFWFVLPFVIGIMLFTLFNFLLPSCRVPFSCALVSGVVTAVFFYCAKLIFNWYVHVFNYNQLIYGALATIPLFLIWLFICWVIILSGAVLCNMLSTSIKAQ
jgi:membrane protein